VSGYFYMPHTWRVATGASRELAGRGVA
jgi:hypothetical protein